ncbi:hypothetical protein [Microbacterium sp. LWH12-1.2]|uniref:hypothetical protein n=2 Tax=Microbacterium sp. LWH12-1.2 TaxID=3135259 RepID=UPI00341C24A7
MAVKAFANSGFEPGIYSHTPGGIHKFAEEYGEAYISMDPARRQRSVGVWMKSGQELGMFSGSAKSAEPVSVSLAGAVFTLMVDGNPVRAIVQRADCCSRQFRQCVVEVWCTVLTEKHMAFGAFRQDRYYPDLFSPGRDAIPAGDQLYEVQDLVEAEPLLYAFDAVAYAIGYVTIIPYNAEAI